MAKGEKSVFAEAAEAIRKLPKDQSRYITKFIMCNPDLDIDDLEDKFQKDIISREEAASQHHARIRNSVKDILALDKKTQKEILATISGNIAESAAGKIK